MEKINLGPNQENNLITPLIANQMKKKADKSNVISSAFAYLVGSIGGIKTFQTVLIFYNPY